MAGCRTAADVLTAIRDNPDAVLAALIVIHQQDTADLGAGVRRRSPGGELAGRIVLQTMLGKLVTMARRDHRHRIEDYVGQLWARIGSYPLVHRPRRIAANLALDTLKQVTRDASTASGSIATLPLSARELELAGFGRSGTEEVTDLNARRVLRAAAELELIDEATRNLLLSVYVEVLSSAEAGRRFGLTAETVRFRCSRAIRKLAAHAAVIAEAA
ncbi:RNA polymerase sigma factor [Microlunatus elymi]|uniref:RNA polymerase sigma factor n=1 Tax=Microlunatus elymi TaxID=2596828 RepID=UPI00143D7F9B|nr:sigma-70 family RNA polymerase sigma factor [Microlunatus elymi]